MGAMTQNAQRQWDIFLAEQCANNALNTLKLSAQMPPIGEQTVNCVQANTEFLVQININTTPNSFFRRVDEINNIVNVLFFFVKRIMSDPILIEPLEKNKNLN